MTNYNHSIIFFSEIKEVLYKASAYTGRIKKDTPRFGVNSTTKGRRKMEQLNGTRTWANLMAAFAGESQARNKYTFYAEQARKEGYEQIADIFLKTANNEKEHAEIWFKLLHDGKGMTGPNLADAADGEHYEWSDMYRKFAEEAKEEGFDRIVILFELVGKVEKEHEERYRKLHKNVSESRVFRREEQTVWICRNCGHIHFGKEAPLVCAVCAHEQAYFEIKPENY